MSDEWRVKASAVDPIKMREDIDRLRGYLKTHERYGDMYSLLVTCGCNLGLRASDLRQLTVGHFNGKTYVELTEIKTFKPRKIIINQRLRDEIDAYLSRWFFVADDHHFFAAQGCEWAVDVKHIHKVIKRSCRALGMMGNYGSHTLRKTFAYHMFLLKPDVTFVKNVFSHSNAYVTQMYVHGNETQKNPDLDGVDKSICDGCKKRVCYNCAHQDAVIADLNL